MSKEYSWQCKECGHVFSIVGEAHVCIPRSVATDAAIPIPKEQVEDREAIWNDVIDYILENNQPRKELIKEILIPYYDISVKNTNP